MGRKIMFLMLAVFTCGILTSCGTTELGYTSDININQSSVCVFQENADGYYIENNGFIYYSDREEIKFQKLCDKIQCDHRDENCNAWLHPASGIQQGIYFYDGKFVFNFMEERGDTDYLVIATKEMDGSDTRELTSIELPSIGGLSGMVFHRNWFLYNLSFYDMENEQTVTGMYVLDLNHPKEAPRIALEEVVADETKGESMFVYSCDEEIAYFTYAGDMYRYNLESSELEKLPENYIGKKHQYLSKDVIYTMDLENNLYKVDTDSYEKTLIMKDDAVFGPCLSDGEYFYRSNYSYRDTELTEEEKGLYVYDLDGNLLQKIDYSIPTTNRAYYVFAEEKIFVFRLEEHAEKIVSYSYFDRSDIETGEVVWTDVVMED